MVFCSCARFFPISEWKIPRPALFVYDRWQILGRAQIFTVFGAELRSCPQRLQWSVWSHGGPVKLVWSVVYTNLWSHPLDQNSIDGQTIYVQPVCSPRARQTARPSFSLPLSIISTDLGNIGKNVVPLVAVRFLMPSKGIRLGSPY